MLAAVSYRGALYGQQVTERRWRKNAFSSPSACSRFGVKAAISQLVGMINACLLVFSVEPISWVADQQWFDMGNLLPTRARMSETGNNRWRDHDFQISFPGEGVTEAAVPSGERRLETCIALHFKLGTHHLAGRSVMPFDVVVSRKFVSASRCSAG